MDVVGLSSSTYLVTYYDTLDSAQAQSGPLFVIIATVVTSGLQSTVTLNSKTYEMKSSELIYYYETIRIDDNTAIIAYDDITTGNGITAQLLTVTSEYVYEPDVTYMYPADDAENGDYEQLVQFGATFKVTTVSTSELNTLHNVKRNIYRCCIKVEISRNEVKSRRATHHNIMC